MFHCWCRIWLKSDIVFWSREYASSGLLCFPAHCSYLPSNFVQQHVLLSWYMVLVCWWSHIHKSLIWQGLFAELICKVWAFVLPRKNGIYASILFANRAIRVSCMQHDILIWTGLYLSNFIGGGVEVLAIEVCAHCQCTVHCSIQYTL